MKKQYLDLMERAVSVYTAEHIRRYTDDVVRDGLREHGFPRLTADLGILICDGRLPQYRDDFIRMMGVCCEQIPNSERNEKRYLGNDFAVKEIVLCLLAAERSGMFDTALTDGWRKALSGIDPYLTYTAIAPSADTPVGNWAAFAAASEQLRRFAGIPVNEEFIETEIGSQMLVFDENGMYRDPDEPMVYDYVTRVQLAVALKFGYNGRYAGKLRETLMRSADLTFFMQSVTGETPFGGRSNQCLHNESCFAAICEYYAAELFRKGDTLRAGQFRQAARLAIENELSWLDRKQVTHVKNNFAPDSGYGCEDYAYFDKYMVTAASFAYLAYCFADDDIPEADCPSLTGGFVRTTSKHFHKVFLNSGTYFAEVEQDADFLYDANGLGRVHRRGAPSALCLSVPFPPEGQHYGLDRVNSEAASICGGIIKDGAFLFSSVQGTKRTLAAQSDSPVCARFDVLLNDGTPLTETLMLTADGTTLTVEGDGEVLCRFPVFDFDGKTKTQIRTGEHSVCVAYGGWICRFDTDGALFDPHNLLCNRNGHYRELVAVGKNKLRLNITISPAPEA